MAQDTSWLDAMSTPVRNGKVLPDGTAVFNLPPNPADVAEQEREAAKEERTQAEKTFRVMTDAERAAQGLPAGGVYQINGLGEIKTIREAPKPTVVAGEVEAKDRENSTRALNAVGVDVLGDTDRVAELIMSSTSGRLERFGAELYGDVTGQATEGMQNIGRLGTIASDLTLAMTGGSLGSQISNSDRDFINQRMGDVGNPEVPANQRLAAWNEVKGRLARAIGVDTAEVFFAQPDKLTRAGATEREAAAGEAFLTERDKELQAKLSQAYASGATLAELQALAQQYGQTIPIASQEELDAARAQGRGIVVTPTGREGSDPEYQAKVAAAADSFEQRLGETGMLELAKEGITFGLSGEASGIGQAIGEALTGDLNVAENYAFGRDVQDELLRRARERTGMAGTAAEIIGGGGGVRLAGNAAFQAGRGLAASGQPVTRQAIQGRMVRNAAIEGAGMGGLAGFGYGEGLEGSATNAAVGLALGGLAGAGGQALMNRAAPATRNAPEPVAPTATPVAPPVMNRLYNEGIGGPEFKPGDKLPAYAHRNIFNKDELQSIIDDGFMLPPSGRTNKYFTMSDDPLPKPGNREGIAIRVPSEKVPFDRAVAARDVELWDNALGAWRPLVASTRSVTDELVTPPLTPEVQAEVGEIARQAIGRGKAARDAQAKLAIMAQVDPEARAAAERLGIELPVDVLSNDARLLTVTGLARSQIGSEAQTAWGQTVSQAIQQSDDTLRAIGATRDLGQVSETVRNRLVKDIDNLEADASVLRREVDDAIDVQGRVDAKSLQAQLTKTINDLGGIDEAKQAFSAEEKKLLAMLGEGDVPKQPTYARLNQVRDQVGRALFKNQGPWVDAPTATLKRYYGALADDQIAHIEAVAGKDIADKMRGSNDLYSQMFKARESMKTVYGKSLEKDIGPLIKTAITTGAKGNGEALRKLMSAVPEDLRPQAILSGIFSLAERQSAQRGFSFAEYAKLYSGLRQNSPIYAEIAKTIGKENEVILRDLYSISKRVAMAENKIVRTGASNQPLLNALNAEGLVSKLAAGAVRRGAVTGGTALAGGVAGGPVGAVVGGGIADALQQPASQAGKSNLDKLHSVLASEPFKDLVEKVADGTVKPADVNRTANDKGFRRFATTVLGIKDFDGRRNWLQSAMTAGASTQATPEQQPTSTIEVR